MGLLEIIIVGTLPILGFLVGMWVCYVINQKCMRATMNLAYKIRENMPYEVYEEVEQENTE
jgi:hypothetical protein